MRLRAAGAWALLIECRDGAHVEAWHADLVRRRDDGELSVTDIVPGARTVLLDGVAPGTAALIASWPDPEVARPPTNTAADSYGGGWRPAGSGSVVEIATTFTGEDLPSVADHWQVSVDEVVRRLVETPLTVAFCGFAPGFAYLRGLADEWAVPRLAAPRPRVPAGAVALADGYVGIYPTASPGGWQLVGHTSRTLFDVRADPPALLTPGTRVRLVPA